MSLYPKYGVYKILLEISGLKKSVVISDLSLKPMSLNPKFTVYMLQYICTFGVHVCTPMQMHDTDKLVKRMYTGVYAF